MLLVVMVVEWGALSQLRVPIFGFPGLRDDIVRDIGSGRVSLAKGIVLTGSIMVHIGMSNAVMTEIVVLAVTMSSEIGFGELCCNCSRSDGLDVGLDMIGMMYN